MTTTEQSDLSIEEIILTSPPNFKCTRNYTGEDERDVWWTYGRWFKDQKYFCPVETRLRKIKRNFRARRGVMCEKKPVLRIRVDSSDEIGAFIKLTNSYCLVCCGEDSHNFINTVKGDLPEIPLINTTLAGCRIVGRMCVGNDKGLLVPDTVYDSEVKEIQNQLPESVKIETLEERLSALGNVIACNDKVALVHPDIGKECEEIIADTLQVEVFRTTVANNSLVGSYCVLNNHGGLVLPGISNSELENLASLLQLPLASGTVNYGSKVVSAGLVVNDWIGYAGMKTTSHEFSIIEKIFQLSV